MIVVSFDDDDIPIEVAAKIAKAFANNGVQTEFVAGVVKHLEVFVGMKERGGNED